MAVDPTSVVVASMTAATPVGHFELLTMARDSAGNADSEQTLEWWVDATPPQPPILASVPSGVSTSNTAVFSFKLSGDTSPGTVCA